MTTTIISDSNFKVFTYTEETTIKNGIYRIGTIQKIEQDFVRLPGSDFAELIPNSRIYFVSTNSDYEQDGIGKYVTLQVVFTDDLDTTHTIRCDYSGVDYTDDDENSYMLFTFPSHRFVSKMIILTNEGDQTNEIYSSSYKIQTLGNNHIVYGIFTRSIHANSNFLWISNESDPTGQTPIWDIREDGPPKYLGLFASWGTDVALVSHKNPMLNIDNTNIFTINDSNDGIFYTFDLTNFMNYVDADESNINNIWALDSDGMKVVYTLTHARHYPYMKSQYEELGAGTISGYSENGGGSGIPSNSGGSDGRNGSRASHRGCCLYTIGDDTYAYQCVRNSWWSYDHGLLTVASINKNDPTIHNWTTNGEKRAIDLNNPSGDNFICKQPMIVKSPYNDSEDRVYLYMISESSHEALIYRIDDDPTLSGYFDGTKQPIYTDQVFAHDIGVNERTEETSFIVSKIPEGMDMPTEFNNFVESSSPAYSGNTTPSFIVTDVSDPENPVLASVVYMNMFSTPSGDEISPWQRMSSSAIAEFSFTHADDCTVCKHLVVTGWNSNEIYFVDMADIYAPKPFWKYDLRRTYQDIIDNPIERCIVRKTPGRNWYEIFVLAGSNGSNDEMEIIHLKNVPNASFGENRDNLTSVDQLDLESNFLCYSSGVKNHTFTDMESFVSLSDELETAESGEYNKLNIKFSDNVDFNTSVYTSKSLFNNITESDRSANTFTPVSGGPSYCHFDEVPATEFYGWCPLSKNSSSHMKQEDGTSGIKFNLKGNRDANGNNTQLNNFSIVYGAPWIVDPSAVDNTIIGLGYGTFKEYYPPVGNGGSASWYDKWVKNNWSGAGIAFARYSAGYSIENIDFNDIKVKSSSMRSSVFASTCYGDINIKNCSFTGSLETLSYGCWDSGVFFSNSYEDSSLNGTITMDNVDIDFYMRGGKYSAGIIGGVLRYRSQPVVHRFSNITINGYNNTEYWPIRNYVEGNNLDLGNFYPSCFMAVVQANNNMVLDNVTINADLSSYKGDWGGNSGGILFGRLLGNAGGTTEIVLKNVHLNGDFLYSSDNGQSGTSASCFVNDEFNNNNPANKTGRGLYPYDPLDSNLTDTQKDELSPSPYGRYNTDEDTEKTENGRSCSYLGHYLIGGYVRTGYLKFSLYNFNIKGQQIFANEFVSANLMDYHESIHHYINDDGPFYVKEDVANANSNVESSTKVAVVSQGSDKIFYYWKPNDPTEDALTKKFMINDVDASYNI